MRDIIKRSRTLLIFFSGLLAVVASAGKLKYIDDGVERCFLELCCPRPFSLKMNDFHNLLSNNLNSFAKTYCDCRIENNNENATCFNTFNIIQTQFEEVEETCHPDLPSNEISKETCGNILDMRTKKHNSRPKELMVTLCFGGLNVFLDDNALGMETDEICVNFSTGDELTPNIIYERWNTFSTTFHDSNNNRYEREDHREYTTASTHDSNSVLRNVTNSTQLSNGGYRYRNETPILNTFETAIFPEMRLMKTLNSNLLKVHDDLEKILFNFNVSSLSQINYENKTSPINKDVPYISSNASAKDINQSLSQQQEILDNISIRNESGLVQNNPHSLPQISIVKESLKNQKFNNFDVNNNNDEVHNDAPHSYQKEETYQTPFVLQPKSGFLWKDNNFENENFEHHSTEAPNLSVSSLGINSEEKTRKRDRSPLSMRPTGYEMAVENPYFYKGSHEHTGKDIMHQRNKNNQFSSKLHGPWPEMTQFTHTFDYDGLMPHEIAALKDKRLGLRVKRHQRLYLNENQNFFKTKLSNSSRHNCSLFGAAATTSGIAPELLLQIPGYPHKKVSDRDVTNNTSFIFSVENSSSVTDSKLDGIASSLIYQFSNNSKPDEEVIQDKQLNQTRTNNENVLYSEMSIDTAKTSPSEHNHALSADDELYGIAPFLSLSIPGKPNNYSTKVKPYIKLPVNCSHREEKPFDNKTVDSFLKFYQTELLKSNASFYSSLAPENHNISTTSPIITELEIYKKLHNHTLHLVETINVTSNKTFPFPKNIKNKNFSSTSTEVNGLSEVPLIVKMKIRFHKYDSFLVINKNETLPGDRKYKHAYTSPNFKSHLQHESQDENCTENDAYELKDCISTIEICRNMTLNLNTSIWEQQFKGFGYECIIYIKLHPMDDGYTDVKLEPFYVNDITPECQKFQIEYGLSGPQDELTDSIRFCGNNASFSKTLSSDKHTIKWQSLKFTSAAPSDNQNAVNIYITANVGGWNVEESPNDTAMIIQPLAWLDERQKHPHSESKEAKSVTKEEESLSVFLPFNFITSMLILWWSILCFVSLVLRRATRTRHQMKSIQNERE